MRRAWILTVIRVPDGGAEFVPTHDCAFLPVAHAYTCLRRLIVFHLCLCGCELAEANPKQAEWMDYRGLRAN